MLLDLTVSEEYQEQRAQGMGTGGRLFIECKLA